MAGVKARSGGHNRLSAEQHELRGTFRPSRHASAVAVAFGAPEVAVVPKALLKGLRKAGRSFVCEMWREFSDWTPADAQLLRNGALDLDLMREAEATMKQDDPVTAARAERVHRLRSASFRAHVAALRLDR